MSTITVKSHGKDVPVALAELREYHAIGMSWGEYVRLRETKTHAQALEAHQASWVALGYGHRFTQ